jgi:hypothetical protein
MIEPPRRKSAETVALSKILAPLRHMEFASGSVGFVLGLLILIGDSLPGLVGSGSPVASYLRRPEVMVWVFLVATQFGFWSSALPFQWRWVRDVQHEFHLRFSRDIAARFTEAVFIFVLPAVLLPAVMPRLGLPHQQVKLFFVNAASAVVAFVPVVGIWFVRAAVDSGFLAAPPADDQGEKAKARNYLFLREHLRRFMMFLGAMVSLGTLAKGAYRHACVSIGQHDNFPPEYVLLHGAFFTGLLALLYVPNYTRLVGAGHDLVDSIFPITSPDLDLRKLGEWESNRKGLEDLLQLRAKAFDDLRTSVSILAPLATSAISILLGDKILLDTK